MKDYSTIVIKIGSSTLTNEQGKLDLNNLKRIVKEISLLKKKVIIVTSGAIVTGAERLGLKSKPKTLPEKQAAAAVGQSILMRQYERAFESFGIPVAQILLTKDAITNKERFINAKNTIKTLIGEGVVPIVNENDTVAVQEIKVGDNDTLSAYVAKMVGADILIILSDVDGFYAKNKNGEKIKLSCVKEITKEILSFAGNSSSNKGTGGMVTKIEAAKIVNAEGIPMVIAYGREKDAISKIVAGKSVGTLFLAK